MQFVVKSVLAVFPVWGSSPSSVTSIQWTWRWIPGLHDDAETRPQQESVCGSSDAGGSVSWDEVEGDAEPYITYRGTAD